MIEGNASPHYQQTNEDLIQDNKNDGRYDDNQSNDLERYNPSFHIAHEKPTLSNPTTLCERTYENHPHTNAC